MDFLNIVQTRQSCRKYSSERAVESEKLTQILEAARLAPSACNGQPYFLTVCQGENARRVAEATRGMGLNGFAVQAPVLIVISEQPYVKSAALGARLKKNDYRSIDIGIVAAYITAQATELGLSTCILGWFNEPEIRSVCELDGTVRLVITLGYAHPDDPLRPKRRKSIEKMIKER